MDVLVVGLSALLAALTWLFYKLAVALEKRQ